MNDLFLFLVLVSIVGFVVGLIKPSLVKMDSRKKVSYIFGGSLVLFFILFGITSDSKKENTNQVNEISQTKEVVTKDTPQQSLSEKITSVIKSNKGSMDASYRDLKIEDALEGSPSETKMLTVKINIESFFNKSSLLRNTSNMSSEIFRTIFSSNSNAYDVYIWYYSKTTDRYGNSKDDVILTYVLNKPTFDKFSWENFDESTLCSTLQQEPIENALNAACNILVNLD